MKTRQFTSVGQVVSWRLCSGCGACVPGCPENAIDLVDVPNRGIRPVINQEKCKQCGRCLEICPGIGASHNSFNGRVMPELKKEWGPALEIQQGWAVDPAIRFKGSSGGLCTALSLFCLERRAMACVLQTCADSQAPWKNTSILSQSRADVLACVGSRYSPSAVCEKLDLLRDADSECVFVGKPCDVAALRKLQHLDEELGSKVGLAISIFCAGTPSSKGTEFLLDMLGLKPEQIESIRYRGYGWPGATSVKAPGRTYQVSYEMSWGAVLSKYTQFRCRLCPDSTGEFADISIGDPWYRKREPSQGGYSLVVVRTEKGREILHQAVEAGYIILEPAESGCLAKSQESLLNRRRHLFGRLLALRLMRIPAPRFVGFSLFRSWLGLSAYEKSRSVLGTIRRAVRRKWSREASAFPRNISTHRRDNLVLTESRVSRISHV